MENNIVNPRKADRLMWFSMWFLGAITTFGLTFFPMFYYSIERRNRHFERQSRLEQRALVYLTGKGQEVQFPVKAPAERNAGLWAASIILLLPAFYIAYFLSKDLMVHEMRQHALLTALFPEEKIHFHGVNIKLCVLLSVFTFGLGIVYWLYKVFNIYNSHFKEQRMIEEKITMLIEG